MRNRGVAAASALVSIVIALSVGLGVASADETPAPPSGGTCNNYGDDAVIVAPFCGANFAPTPASTTTTPPFVTISSRPTTPIICQIRPTSEECVRPTGLQTLQPAP